MNHRFVLASLAALLGAVTVLPSQAAQTDGAQPALAGPFVLRMPGVASDLSTGETFDLGVSPSGLRYCRFLPGLSQPKVLGPAPATPEAPLPPLPANTVVSQEVTAEQLEFFDFVNSEIVDLYVNPALNGLNWSVVSGELRAKVQAGLLESDFQIVIKRLVTSLGDGHSYYQTPQEVAEQQLADQQGQSFVGVGVLVQRQGDGQASVIVVLPGSPAASAGLLPHDLLLSVNGQPIYLPDGRNNLRGEPGTVANVTVKRGDNVPFVVSIPRQAIVSNIPIEACKVAGAKIGYIMVPSLLDTTIGDQVRAALQKLMADGPLDGLILDNRLNGGGSETQAKAVLGFFTSGNQGALVGSDPRTFAITPEAIGNSQNVPLVVLVGEGSVSYGEITSGVLGRSGRATIIGQTTRGNVELLTATTFGDNSRMWLATLTFQPVGLPAGIWEDTGIVPAITVNGLWHEFTEMTDPVLARAIAELQN